MTLQEAIYLIEVEQAANKKAVDLNLKKNQTAGGDAQTTLDYLKRRMKVIEAMDIAIKTMKDMI